MTQYHTGRDLLRIHDLLFDPLNKQELEKIALNTKLVEKWAASPLQDPEHALIRKGVRYKNNLQKYRELNYLLGMKRSINGLDERFNRRID